MEQSSHLSLCEMCVCVCVWFGFIYLFGLFFCWQHLSHPLRVEDYLSSIRVGPGRHEIG